MTEIERIRADRAWWEAAAPPGWVLLGFTDRDNAMFSRQGNSILMCGVAAASIHQRVAAARLAALQEAAQVCQDRAQQLAVLLPPEGKFDNLGVLAAMAALETTAGDLRARAEKEAGSDGV